MNKSIRLAFCGIITALSTVLMFLTGIITIGTYTLPALSGLLLTVVVIEIGPTWAWSVYIATSVLSFFIAPDKEAALLFILFFGYYPIIKSFIEQIKNKYLSYLLKLVVFNISVIAAFYISIYLLGVPKDSFEIGGVYLPWILLGIGNITFVLYDFAFSNLIVMYFQRFHATVHKWLK